MFDFIKKYIRQKKENGGEIPSGFVRIKTIYGSFLFETNEKDIVAIIRDANVKKRRVFDEIL